MCLCTSVAVLVEVHPYKRSFHSSQRIAAAISQAAMLPEYRKTSQVLGSHKSYQHWTCLWYESEPGRLIARFFPEQRWCDKLRYMCKTQPNYDKLTDAEVTIPEPHVKWGYFPLTHRFSREQVVLEFHATNKDRTWPHDRECYVPFSIRVTWDMTYSANLAGPQQDAVLCFKGTGGRVSQAEKDAYHPNVKVVWTPSGWLNREANTIVVEEVWGPFKEMNFPKQPCLMTCRTVPHQCCKSYVNSLARHMTSHLNMEPGYSRIHDGVGKMHKDLYLAVQREWMLEGDNLERFRTLKFSARRILMTLWVGEARQRYIEQKRTQHANCVLCSGLGISLDGENDEKITVKSNPVFTVQPFVHWEGLEESVKAWILDDVAGGSKAGV